MSNVPADIRTKISTEAAESFAESYYLALRSSRATIASFYLPKSESPDGKIYPSLVLNGASLDDGMTVQKFFIEEMPFTHYEAQSIDCHVLNPNLKPLESGRKAEAERNMSLLVSVSGWVRLQELSKGPMRGFSETFVLVPNEEFPKGKAPKTDKKSWLIQTQNFRYVT
ncbi:NTF2-like protein [Viridothelium virens]|uniref:NTF2-like protein n=1 Tax=Viridothelium virens TaxID=1048519 RepID=A0A6A6HIF1_VIRVR|nr:NTF2-like protein [Viridothelium virens]